MTTKRPEIIIIAAIAQTDRAIGKNGKIPWPRIPADIQRFQQETLGHVVIMGRKTWEYDLEKHPLAGRRNIVITSQAELGNFSADGVLFVGSLNKALAAAADAEKAFIVGGATIYAQSLELVDTLDLTLVEGNYEGDTFFPAYEHLLNTEFTLDWQEQHPGFGFVLYRRATR